MIYVLAALAAVVAAVVGWFVTGAVAVWIAGLYGMSDFEGGRGMFAFLGVGPIGGLVSMVTAAWLVLRSAGDHPPIGPTLLRLGAVLLGVALLVAGGIWLRLATLDTYTDELPPTLEFEVRVPLALAKETPGDLRVELHTAKNAADGLLDDRWSPTEADRRSVAGRVSLDFKTASRLLVVSMPGEPTRLFRLSLGRDPGSTARFSEWQRPAHVDAGGEAGIREAPAGDPVEVRYRVTRAGD